MWRVGLLLALAVTAAFVAAHVAQPAHAAGCPPRPPDTSKLIAHPRWLTDAIVTEYYPVRESWFAGAPVRVPGLATKHRDDWLFGPHGVAMNGEGLGADGRYYRFAGPYDIGWVNEGGHFTSGCWTGHWTNGEPAWLALGWRNVFGEVTYKLGDGLWSNGTGRRYVPPPSTLRFQPGRSSLPFWHTVAVDPRRVPRGSRVFIPMYCDSPSHGWFAALDTGGAIIGDHFDVYRSPPATLQLRSFRGQRAYVIPPGTRGVTPHCRG